MGWLKFYSKAHSKLTKNFWNVHTLGAYMFAENSKYTRDSKGYVTHSRKCLRNAYDIP